MFNLGPVFAGEVFESRKPGEIQRYLFGGGEAELFRVADSR